MKTYAVAVPSALAPRAAVAALVAEARELIAIADRRIDRPGAAKALRVARDRVWHALAAGEIARFEIEADLRSDAILFTIRVRGVAELEKALWHDVRRAFTTTAARASATEEDE
ncbi:MAG TPA: hypothetical protein VGR87_03940 [Candidatus Limnocylindria bacterium]|jgi:hypothetical protein|nr:hypothetical protein [Candidatus Limnocylindria bacterium]